MFAKAIVEKACLLYEFAFNLNPSDTPNDAQTSSTWFIIMSNNYKRPVSSIFKKIDGTLGAAK